MANDDCPTPKEVPLSKPRAILHLLGTNHEKLTFRHNDIDRRLTDAHDDVIGEILA